MIRPIDNGNSYAGAYGHSGKKAARMQDDAPAFLLPGEDNGVIWERGEQKERKSVKHMPSAAEAEKAETEKAEESGTEQRETHPLRDFFGRVRGFFGKLLHDIWYGGEEEGKNQETQAASEEQAIFSQAEEGEEDPEERIRALIAAKDEEGLMDVLTDHGKKKAAKNTELLTHYDRHGRIVKQQDSEVGRILTAEQPGKRNVVRRPQGNYRRYV